MRYLLLRVLSSIVILISLIGLIWGSWPAGHQAIEQVILPDGMKLPSIGRPSIPALLEVRQVSLEWPEFLRTGDKAEIRLVFEPIDREILAPQPEGEFEDAYINYSLMAEGRYEVAGLKANPANPTRKSLPAGQKVQFTWQVSPPEAKSYTGNVWLLLRFLPLSGGSAEELPIFVHEVHIQTFSLLGLSGSMARLLGGIGIIVGIAFNFDFLYQWYKKRHKGH